ncbi:MAG: ATP-binding cassette domain-containing protein [Acidobacteria bacterium]|nr:ATP-binding cassette domain-containing protein [Acidobacteriota bacterium]
MSLLRLDSVSFRYVARPESQGRDRAVLSDVSFELQAGESALVLGDNGSGKSTLGRLIGGLLRPTAGSISIGGEPLDRVPVRARPSRSIYVSQVSYLQFFRATLADEITLAAKQSGHPPPPEETIARFSLPSLETNPRDLTYPEMWRLQLLLLGGVFRPSVMFIDEIVAPGAPAQREALEFTLSQRHAQGRATLLAYQRPLDTRFHRVFRVDGGAVTAPESVLRGSFLT